MSLLICAAWIGHTDASREMAQDIDRAIALAGLKQEAAADLMGISASRLAHQLRGMEPLSVYRLCALPYLFHFAWLGLRAKRIGAELWSADQLAVVRGAAVIGFTRGFKRMAKCLPEFFQKEQAS